MFRQCSKRLPVPLPSSSSSCSPPLFSVFHRTKFDFARRLGLISSPEEKAKRSEAKSLKQEELIQSLPNLQAQDLVLGRKPPHWATPDGPLPPLVAPLFIPENGDPLIVRNLLDQTISFPAEFTDHITLLTIAYNAHAMSGTTKWVSALLDKFPQQRAVQGIQLSVVNSRIVRAWFAGQTLRNLKKQVPPHRHSHTCMLVEEVEMRRLHELKHLRLEPQQLVAHILLIDRAGRVRWRAFGHPMNDEEIVKLLSTTEKLLQEGRGKKHGGGGGG